MRKFRVPSFLILLAAFSSLSAYADGTPTLSNLTQSESDSIIKNFGNAISFRSVEPPSANGKIWGFGLGLAVEVTSPNHVNSALAAHGSTENIPILPMGDIVVIAQAPLGLGLEFGFLPRKTVGGFSAKRTAFNVKWTFTDVLLRARTPFDAALRVGYGMNEFEYSQTVSGVLDTVQFDSNALRAELAMSRKFFVFEPYLGLGLLRTSSTLSNSASVALYSFTSAHTYDFSSTSFLVNLGTEIRLVFLTLGAQVEWAFGETTGAFKLGFKF